MKEKGIWRCVFIGRKRGGGRNIARCAAGKGRFGISWRFNFTS